MRNHKRIEPLEKYNLGQILAIRSVYSAGYEK